MYFLWASAQKPVICILHYAGSGFFFDLLIMKIKIAVLGIGEINGD